MALQERLLRAVREGHREGGAGVARAHVKDVELAALAAQIGVRLAPVDLGLGPRLVHLRDEPLHPQAKLAPATMDVLAHRRLSDVRGVLVAQPLPDPLRRVPLLARRLAVALKPRVDQRPVGPELRRRSLRRRSLGRRHWRGQRLPDRPPMDAVALGQLPDREALSIPIPPDLLEQLHS